MAHRTIRSDGWTPARQVAFLEAPVGTRSVAAAARAAGMSRESAYRLRARDPHGLFAHLWDLALSPSPLPLLTGKGHSLPLGDGRLTRLIGNHDRREYGNFTANGYPCPKTCPTDRQTDRTQTS